MKNVWMSQGQGPFHRWDFFGYGVFFGLSFALWAGEIRGLGRVIYVYESLRVIRVFMRRVMVKGKGRRFDGRTRRLMGGRRGWLVLNRSLSQSIPCMNVKRCTRSRSLMGQLMKVSRSIGYWVAAQ